MVVRAEDSAGLDINPNVGVFTGVDLGCSKAPFSEEVVSVLVVAGVAFEVKPKLNLGGAVDVAFVVVLELAAIEDAC